MKLPKEHKKAMKAVKEAKAFLAKVKKEKVRKPRRIKSGYVKLYDKFVPVIFEVKGMSLGQCKQLQSWLTKAIKYLEQK